MALQSRREIPRFFGDMGDPQGPPDVVCWMLATEATGFGLKDILLKLFAFLMMQNELRRFFFMRLVVKSRKRQVI